jgi:hypothetical protein
MIRMMSRRFLSWVLLVAAIGRMLHMSILPFQQTCLHAFSRLKIERTICMMYLYSDNFVFCSTLIILMKLPVSQLIVNGMMHQLTIIMITDN